jgi:hypothetical protein
MEAYVTPMAKSTHRRGTIFFAQFGWPAFAHPALPIWSQLEQSGQSVANANQSDSGRIKPNPLVLIEPAPPSNTNIELIEQ